MSDGWLLCSFVWRIFYSLNNVYTVDLFFRKYSTLIVFPEVMFEVNPDTQHVYTVTQHVVCIGEAFTIHIQSHTTLYH